MKILVTGAGSFAGINIFEYFIKKRIYDISGMMSPTTAHYPDKIINMCKDNGLRLTVGDIRNIDDVRRAMEDCDAVIHEEAIIEAPTSVQIPRMVHDINVTGFVNVLECARELGCKVIATSSNIAYGEPIYRPIDENHQQNPNSPYGATRACIEKYAIAYYHSFDLPVVILRYSNLYGPYGKGVINCFINDAKEKNEVTITGGGVQTRTYTYITDAIDCTIYALNNSKALGQTYNVAGPETASLMDIYKILSKHFPKLKIKKVENWKGDILSDNYSISNEKAKKELGFEPKYTIEKGIKEIIDHENISV
jgi:nucleoside-diphosphate-sugar epimerase